jgi:3-oxoacyl-[acyl-carrier protein] reductase
VLPVNLMRTRAQARFGDAERWTEFMKRLAFGRAAEPEGIAWMAAFLASERSGRTTGSIVTIDGGAHTTGHTDHVPGGFPER